MLSPMVTPSNAGSKSRSYDVILSGGGLVGLSLAIALADAGLEVAVVDRLDPATVVDEPFDGRASAIARGSQHVLAATGVWQHVGSEAAPILDIRVSDGKVGRPPSRLFVHFDADEFGEGPMGWIVENRIMRRALHARARELPNLTLFAPASLERAERREEAAFALLSNGQSLKAPLLIAAEGRNSPLRQSAGIAVTRWDYPQSGIVCTLYHEYDHAGTAHEHFLPAGPFAVLPLTDDERGRHRSSIVWTEKREMVETFMALDDVAFAAEVQRRFGDGLGKITVEGYRWSYPLSLMHAERYYARRLALVGDTAHGVHPIAGQGFNLGLRDVAALVAALRQALADGRDIGSHGVLSGYGRARQPDQAAIVGLTTALALLFSNDHPALAAGRNLGLAAMAACAPFKSQLAWRAMGKR